ncbi:MAG: chlorophyll a/b binding light-harvesting protein [Cyanobacteria bacterium P01_D01_bin.1]
MVSTSANGSAASEAPTASPLDYQNLLEGNARLVPLSGQLLGAHIAHAGLIMFWAGSITISQALNYDQSLPLEDQGLALISNISRLGWGLDASGQLNTLYPAFVIGMLHLVASAVLGAGGLFHVFGGPKRLADANGWAKKFHYEWDDPNQLTLILGHHLLFLGAAALAFVAKATQFGGIYDPAVGQVRIIEPNLNPADIFGYLVGLTPDGWSAWGIASVNNLEDVIGGHAWIGAMLIIGGIFHILVNAKIIFPIRLNADAILSYSLGSLAFMAFVSWAFVSHNTTVFPPELYGTAQLGGRSFVQLALGILFLGGHLWHAYRGIAIEEGKPPASLT